MSGNRRYHVCFNLTQIVSHNNLIPKYISFSTYPLLFLCFIVMYSYRAARFFTDEFSVTIFKIKRFHFEFVKSFIQSKEYIMPFSTGSEFTFHERNIKLKKQEYEV
jgi:hypothetical protein